MSLPVLERSQLPQEQAAKLLPEETVHHFGYIDAKGGGCATTSTAKQWILVTRQRILFEAAVKEGSGTQEKYVHQSGSIPMAKVSYVGTSTSQVAEGCSQKETTKLRINSSGGEIVLAIPTHEEAGRIQRVIDVIISEK
jgi:hypothetical protein